VGFANKNARLRNKSKWTVFFARRLRSQLGGGLYYKISLRIKIKRSVRKKFTSIFIVFGGISLGK